MPDIDPSDPCFNQTQAILPANVTRQANLPNTDFSLIAVAPWLNMNCTRSYLVSAQRDPIRAFIFYQPDNGTSLPPPISSPVWDMQDGGVWKSQAQYPVYAVPGSLGNQMMIQLSHYSGNLTKVPGGHTLMSDYQIDPRSYVRVYTEIDITAQSSLPALWVFLLIVVGGLLVILGSTSFLMHLVQRRRRDQLRRRIARGHVDLEALGIKRLTVPKSIIDKMPLFIYTCREDEVLRESQKSTNTQHEAEGTKTGPISATDESATFSSIPVPDSTLSSHEYKQHAQPTCPICLEDFISGSTTIRELPCGHIFHPECIDSFLGNNSSLCPMCKKSTLPLGYCPERITNAMVRRERAIRRLRSRVNLNEDGQDIEGGWAHRMSRWRTVARGIVFGREEPEATNRTQNYDPNLALRSISMQPTTRGTAATAESLGITRHDIAQRRAPELLEGVPVMEEVDLDDQREHQQSKCKSFFNACLALHRIATKVSTSGRKAFSKLFPGFK